MATFDQLQQFIFHHQNDRERINELQLDFHTTCIPPNTQAATLPTTLLARLVDELGLKAAALADPPSFNLKTVHEMRLLSLQPQPKAPTGNLYNGKGTPHSVCLRNLLRGGSDQRPSWHIVNRRADATVHQTIRPQRDG